MSYKGRFRPNYPEKYKGNPTNICYRSGWELKLMSVLDNTADVLEWSSEEVIVNYYDPATRKHRRYFPDFVVKTKQTDGTIKTVMIEVKPAKETKVPNVPKTVTLRTKRRYMRECLTYATNQAKWQAAIEFCADRKWSFEVWTEHDLGIKY